MSAETRTPDAWYTEDGPETDVVLSTRVRLARNLSGFVFPVAIKSDDADSVESLIFDAFNHLENPERFQMVRMSHIDSLGRRILAERGVIDPETGNEPWRAVVIRADGVLSATVNMEDHLRLAAFTPGLSLWPCSGIVTAADRSLQDHLQFSAQAGTGYLTSNLFDVGTGMKASVLLCLPGLCMNGLLDRVIREYLAQGFTVRGYYDSDGSASLGCLYQLSGGSSSAGDIPGQIGRMEQAAGKLADLERKSRAELYRTAPTTVEDTVFRAIVAAKYARFINLREAVDLIHRIKLGLSLGLVTGTTDRDLTALLYRVQTAHIGFVILNGSIIIEDDVVSEELRTDRLRAMVIQEVLKTADICERR